jgi:hypothetical protein
MPILMKALVVAKPDLVDQRLESFSPEQREHFRESVRHNHRVLKRLSKM